MKFLLKNTKSGEETLCDKITIEGFDYYVVKHENIIDNTWYYNSWCNGIFYNCMAHKAPLELYSKSIYWNEFIGKGINKNIIATNNPNIEIPQVVDGDIQQLTKF